MTDPYEVKEIEELEEEMGRGDRVHELMMMDCSSETEGWVELECLFDSVE